MEQVRKTGYRGPIHPNFYARARCTLVRLEAEECSMVRACVGHHHTQCVGILRPVYVLPTCALSNVRMHEGLTRASADLPFVDYVPTPAPTAHTDLCGVPRAGGAVPQQLG
jgi:hypothetical protein